MARRRATFDPRAILGALEANYVDYVLIGALARILRGTDEITEGVDVCPSFKAPNLERVSRALTDLGADNAEVSEKRLTADPVLSAVTPAGALNVVGVPAGAPNGFIDLRRAATREDLGQGIRPLVASTADLARLAAALGRENDLARLPELRQILELEVRRSSLVGQGAGRQASVAERPMSRSRRAVR